MKKTERIICIVCVIVLAYSLYVHHRTQKQYAQLELLMEEVTENSIVVMDFVSDLAAEFAVFSEPRGVVD